MARPSDYSEELALTICAAIVDGKGLKRACEADGMPHMRTVYRWLAAHEAFRHMYAHAREAQADALFDEVLEIADDTSRDWLQTDNGPQLDQEHVQRSRVRIDARKWMAARLAPRKYGDKLDVTSDVTHNYVARVPEAQHDAAAWLRQYAHLKQPNEEG